MPKITLAAPLDPEMKGVGYFPDVFENAEPEKHLMEFFAFLEMPFVEASTFVLDYQIRFSNENLEVVVFNDDFGCEALGTSPEGTVYFSITSDSEVALMKFQKKLEQVIKIVRVA